MSSNKRRLGVVIGRFQCAQLHVGHHILLHKVAERNYRVLVLIGDRSTPPTATNPLSYAARVAMFKSIGSGWGFARLMDHPSNQVWSQNVDTAISDYINNLQNQHPDIAEWEVTLYTGRQGFKPFYSGKYPVEYVDCGCDTVTATNLREYLASHPTFEDEAFRKGIVYAMQVLPPRTYHTVDVGAVHWRDGKWWVLLGRKANMTDWRFPGGFVEPNETFVRAAARELMEETHLRCERLTYVQDFIIDDWRLRGARNVTHKTVFLYGFCQNPHDAKPGDDLAEVQWFPIEDVARNPQMLAREHRILMLNGMMEGLDQYEAIQEANLPFEPENAR